MKTRTKRIFLNIISSIIVALTVLASFFTIICLTFHVVYSETYVKGYSMLPTLNEKVYDIFGAKGIEKQGDYIFVNNYAEARRNDIVVAKVDWHSDLIIKRVVGVPGDIIQIKDNNEQNQYEVYVNDKLFYSRKKSNLSFDNNPYLGGTNGYYQEYLKFFNRFPNNTIEKEDGTQAIKVNSNEWFLMGDNWGGTTDSIEKGVVHTKDIIGRVDLFVSLGENKELGILKFMLKVLFN